MYGLYECVFPDMYISPDMDTSLLSRPPQWKLISANGCIKIRQGDRYLDSYRQHHVENDFLAILVQP